MLMSHTTKVYPPRVKMTVALRNPHSYAVSILSVEFLGSSRESKSQLDTELVIFLAGNLSVFFPSHSYRIL